MLYEWIRPKTQIGIDTKLLKIKGEYLELSFILLIFVLLNKNTMTKKEFFEENYLNLLNQAKESLAFMVKAIINKINEDEHSDETHVLLHEFGIAQPIYREDLHNDDLNETISSAWVDSEGVVGFEVDTFESGYDISMDDLDMDMVLYLLGELEEIDIENLELP